jgi:hypothetical protein
VPHFVQNLAFGASSASQLVHRTAIISFYVANKAVSSQQAGHPYCRLLTAD